MGHSIKNLAYWGPLLDRSLESTWETVIEHKASSLIAVFLIAIVHSLWKHRREAVSVKIEAGWKHKLKWAISALKKEFIPIVCITLIVFFAFLLIHVCFVTPQAISLEANRQYKTTLESMDRKASAGRLQRLIGIGTASCFCLVVITTPQ